MKYIGQLTEDGKGGARVVCAEVVYSMNEPESLRDRIADWVRRVADGIDDRQSLPMRFGPHPDLEDAILEHAMMLAMDRFGELLLAEMTLRRLDAKFTGRAQTIQEGRLW